MLSSNYNLDHSCTKCTQPRTLRTSVACVLLRYGGRQSAQKDRIWHSYSDCAAILGISYARAKKVIQLFDDGIPLPCECSLFPQKPVLKPHHLEALISKEVLQHDAHLSLKQRCVKFNEKFNDFHLSYNKLRKVFKNSGIKKRVLNSDIVLTPK